MKRILAAALVLFAFVGLAGACYGSGDQPKPTGGTTSGGTTY
jgi:cyclic lactone autoinducer peptide